MKNTQPEPSRVQVVESIRRIDDLARLALPCRVYTNTHREYVAEVPRLRSDPRALRGVRSIKPASLLCDFTPRFEWI